ncbi:hypothetical protein B0T24DRAFT_119587 [Lasiosphaeria ovina]|uniref:Uncharacterized protein n=1 Tax=Lasiosphaeria ovina TaxID=92902 RepID=A0AAE0JTP5_9PEZI|nr:hypothetical protein B0T24DRAFT_119587 [Lasiosphaeria ovina]
MPCHAMPCSNAPVEACMHIFFIQPIANPAGLKAAPVGLSLLQTEGDGRLPDGRLGLWARAVLAMPRRRSSFRAAPPRVPGAWLPARRSLGGPGSGRHSRMSRVRIFPKVGVGLPSSRAIRQGAETRAPLRRWLAVPIPIPRWVALRRRICRRIWAASTRERWPGVRFTLPWPFVLPIKLPLCALASSAFRNETLSLSCFFDSFVQKVAAVPFLSLRSRGVRPEPDRLNGKGQPQECRHSRGHRRQSRGRRHDQSLHGSWERDRHSTHRIHLHPKTAAAARGATRSRRPSSSASSCRLSASSPSPRGCSSSPASGRETRTDDTARSSRWRAPGDRPPPAGPVMRRRPTRRRASPDPELPHSSAAARVTAAGPMILTHCVRQC